jgi:hypothetical protein
MAEASAFGSTLKTLSGPSGGRPDPHGQAVTGPYRSDRRQMPDRRNPADGEAGLIAHPPHIAAFQMITGNALKCNPYLRCVRPIPASAELLRARFSNTSDLTIWADIAACRIGGFLGSACRLRHFENPDLQSSVFRQRRGTRAMLDPARIRSGVISVASFASCSSPRISGQSVISWARRAPAFP